VAQYYGLDLEWWGAWSPWWKVFTYEAWNFTGNYIKHSFYIGPVAITWFSK